MDPIRNRTARGARRTGRGVAPPGLHRRRRRKSPTGSRWVPIEFRPPRTGRRQESESLWSGSGAPRHGEEPRGDRMGTASEPRSLRIEPDGERLGTEWGLRPFTIEQTTEDVTGIHRLVREHAPRATAVSPPAAGSGYRAEIRDKAGATVRDASQTSDQDGPEPGHLTTKARSEKPEAAQERSDGERTGPQRWRRSRRSALKPCADGRRRALPTA
jgi:hypothetical protein